MTLDWMEVSEMVSGLVLKRRLSLNAIRPDQFAEPYNKLIHEAQKSGAIEIDSLLEKVGFEVVQPALQAEKNVNGTGDIADWVRVLETAKFRYHAGQQMQKWGRKLEQGDEIDWEKVQQVYLQNDIGMASDFVPLSDVTRGEVPFTSTGWGAIDKTLGGIPKVGMTIVGGNPGVGKTSFMAKLTSCYAKAHPNELVAVFSLEMILSELSKRFDEVIHLEPEIQKRILLNENGDISAGEILTKAASIKNLGMIAIDFADLLIEGESSESVMANIYRTFMKGAKRLRLPIILLAQLSGNYVKGIPKPNHLRYTRLAEALGWMILMLYVPETSWYDRDEDDNDVLPVVDNMGYICAWKVRGGFRIPECPGPGAIQIPFCGQHGWGNKGRWFSLRKA